MPKKYYKKGLILKWFNFFARDRHPSSKHVSWKGFYKASQYEETKASFLLELLYPNGISNYVYKPNMYQFFYYVPSQDLYIDYYGFLSHQGPYNAKRIFNPNNKDDIDFLKEVKIFTKPEKRKYWLSVDRVNTWAKTDYEKYLFMKLNYKNYKIFWSVEEIELCCKPYMLDLCQAFMDVYESTKDLENVVLKNTLSKSKLLI